MMVVEKFVLTVDNSTWMSASKNIPFIEEARARGYKVIRCSSGEPRFQSGEHIFIRDSHLDPETLYEKLKPYQGRIKFVFSGYDQGTSVVSHLSARLQIPYFGEKLASFTTKLGLYHGLRRLGLGTPDTWLLRSRQELESLPDDREFVIKPSLSTGAVAKQVWDYRYFSKRSELLKFLNESGLTGQFIDSSSHSTNGDASLVQEYIRADKYLDVHAVVGPNGEFHVFLTGEFETRDKSMLIVESRTCECDSSTVTAIKCYLESFSQMGLRNIIVNLQFALKNGQLFLFDVNWRIAGIWTYLHRLMMPDFVQHFFDLIESKNAENFRFPALQNKFYLKTPYYLSAGKIIESLEIPTDRGDGVLVAYEDHLVSGFEVPRHQHSIQPMPQIFSVGSDLNECRRKIESLIGRTQVVYKT